MNRTILDFLRKRLAYVLLGALLAAPQLASAALSISQVPLFITISMPPNITVLLDDSGSMEWGHVPDGIGNDGVAAVEVQQTGVHTINANVVVTGPATTSGTVGSTPHTSSSSVVVTTGTVNNGTVTSTPHTNTSSVVVANGTVNSGTVTSTPNITNGSVTSTCTGTISHHTCSTGTYDYSCAAGFTLNGPTSGSSSTGGSDTCTEITGYTYTCASGFTLSGSSSGSTSTPPSGTKCQQQTYNYSCSSGYTLNPATPTSGTSSTASGYTCTQQVYLYTCSTGYTLNGSGTGTTSTPPGTTTCTQQTYNYSCSSGYTLSPASPTSGTSSTGSGYTCGKTTYTYSCSSGFTLNGPSTGTTSTAPSTTTCTEQTYAYSCPAGYTLSGTASGTSSTAPSGDSCSESVNGTTDIFTGFSSVYVPDTWHYKSAAFNPLAYDPTITYTPGYSDTGTKLSTSFTAAYVNPYNTSLGYIDLSSNYLATRDYDPSTTVTQLFAKTTNCSIGGCGSVSGGVITPPVNPEHCGSGTCVTDEVNDCQNFNTSGGCNTGANFIPTAAFYYLYTPTSATAQANACGSHTYVSGGTTKTVPQLQDDACYSPVTVSSTSGPGGTDERQNFANWFSFYRTRNLTTNTSANIAFTGLNSTYRVAWRDLNTCSDFSGSACSGWDSANYDNRIATFSGTHRQTFFDWLQHYPASGGTPLRTALQAIGTYYQTSGTTSPYAFNPQVTDSPEYVCRPNYAVIMTDGLWNDTNTPSPDMKNADGSTATMPDGTSFPAKTYPFYDSYSDTLADVAFYYWMTNLRPDLGLSTSLQYMPYTKNVSITDSAGNSANLIPYWNPQDDPASWPHMVTFTIGLGMTSTITSPVWGGSTYAGGYDNVATGNIAWPQPSGSSGGSPNNVYDLWHAALDSRGQFFSADSPADVQQAFNTIVNRIQGRVGSSSAIAVNSTRLDSNTFIYQAQFNSSNWTGEVLAFSINSNGSVNTTPNWQASANIPAASSRNILTWNETSGGGTTFSWTNLNAAEQADLNQNINDQPDTSGPLRLNYLTGDQSEEQDQSGGIFRIRSSILGDIVDSNPEYVGTQNYGFDSNALPEGASYDSFVASKTNRTYPHMLYVGANDAMLHGIDADNGKEIFDYIPRGMYANISALPDPLYTHEFFVDGSPTSVDAYLNGAWSTLVVATTGAGAKEIFVLDVTDASTMTGSKVLWDYDGTDGSVAGTLYTAAGAVGSWPWPDTNMGYTINEPTIVRMHDGDWYVLFGNGYNSANQQAAIYLYNLNTQHLYVYSTGVGSAGSPNGMSSPSPVDYNNDRITDAIYAGDLQGNIWKLDVSGASPSTWKYTSYGNSNASPLFTAHDGSGNVQPITDRPQVGRNANSQVMVFFGTGTYFLSGDNTVGSNPPVMSAYGIIDDLGNTAADQVKGTSSTDRSELLAQYIVGTYTNNGNTYRITTSYAMTSSEVGWYIDLLTPPTGSATVGTAQGERSVSDAVLDLGRIVFTTLIPEGNACQYGGVSFLMELDENTGGALSSSPFDTNGDGLVNSQDMVTVTYYDPASGKNVTKTVAVGGQESNVGIIKTPGIIASGQLQYKYYSGSTGAIGVTTEKGSDASQRISWQQLQ